MKRKLLVVLMAFVMLVAYIPMMTAPVSAYSTSDFKGKDCTSDTYAAASIDYVMAKYPQWSSWKLGGQCWGYAEKVCDIIGSSWSTTYYNKKLTKKNVLALLKGIKAGSHVRFYRDEGDDYMCHSVVIFKCTDKEVIWADNNKSGSDIVDYHVDTVEDFANLNYDKITMIRKVTSYRKSSEPKLASKQVNGGVKLIWTKSPGASKYYVYRASSEYGSYKKIATVKSSKRSYTDYSGTLGKKRYYKVKAVRSSGSRYSDVAKGTRKLKMVTGFKKSYQANTGKIKLSWKKVSGATSYKIYRYDENKWKYKLIKTTTKLSYIDSGAKTPGECYDYMIKAYSSKAKVSSPEKEISVIRGVARPTEPTVTGVTEYDSTPKIKWTKSKGADGYYVYRATSKTGTYKKVGTVYDNTGYYYDTDTLTPGKTYYYKIKAYVEGGYYDIDSDGWWYWVNKEVKSSYSVRTYVKIPKKPVDPAPTPDPIDPGEDSEDGWEDWSAPALAQEPAEEAVVEEVIIPEEEIAEDAEIL